MPTLLHSLTSEEIRRLDLHSEVFLGTVNINEMSGTSKKNI